MVDEISHNELVAMALKHAQAGDSLNPGHVARLLADELLIVKAQMAKLQSAFDAADAEATRLRTANEALRAKAQEYLPIVHRAIAVNNGTSDRYHGLISRATAHWIVGDLKP